MGELLRCEIWKVRPIRREGKRSQLKDKLKSREEKALGAFFFLFMCWGCGVGAHRWGEGERRLFCVCTSERSYVWACEIRWASEPIFIISALLFRKQGSDRLMIQWWDDSQIWPLHPLATDGVWELRLLITDITFALQTLPTLWFYIRPAESLVLCFSLFVTWILSYWTDHWTEAIILFPCILI